MFRRRGFLVQFLFALLLAFAQQQAIWHELSHDLERIHASAKDVAGHEDAFCAKCVALAHLGHGNHASAVELAVSSPAPPRVAHVRDAAVALSSVRAYQSRAPPFSS